VTSQEEEEIVSLKSMDRLTLAVEELT